MGYEVSIQRPRFWEGGIHKITPAEWQSVIVSDPEFELSGHLGGEPMYCWKIHPKRPEFDYSENSGFISVGVLIDAAILGKMHEIAQKLGAVVRGEQGEGYRVNAEGEVECDPSPFDP